MCDDSSMNRTRFAVHNAQENQNIALIMRFSRGGKSAAGRRLHVKGQEIGKKATLGIANKTCVFNAVKTYQLLILEYQT